MSLDQVKSLTFIHHSFCPDDTICYRAIEIKWWGYDKYYLYLKPQGSMTNIRLTGSFDSLSKNTAWTLILHQETYLRRLVRMSCWPTLAEGQIGILITKDARLMVFKPDE